MSEFLHIGFDSYVEVSKILIIVPADRDRLHRELKKRNVEKNSEAFWNACGGKEAKSLLILEGGRYVASAINPQTLAKRSNEERGGITE